VEIFSWAYLSAVGDSLLKLTKGSQNKLLSSEFYFYLGGGILFVEMNLFLDAFSISVVVVVILKGSVQFNLTFFKGLVAELF
jgi:hypothetical protein